VHKDVAPPPKRYGAQDVSTALDMTEAWRDYFPPCRR